MPRNDLVLATSGISGTSFGADCSEALQSLATMFDDNGWPADTFPNMRAINATTGEIGFRNRANNDWIIVGDYDGSNIQLRSPQAINKFELSDAVITAAFRGIYPIVHNRVYGAGSLFSSADNDIWYSLSTGNTKTYEITDPDLYTIGGANAAATTITRNGRYEMTLQANMSATSDPDAAFAVRVLEDGTPIGIPTTNARNQRPVVSVTFPYIVTNAPVVIDFEYKGFVASGNFQMSNGLLYIKCWSVSS